jgi:hypothetical protein
MNDMGHKKTKAERELQEQFERMLENGQLGDNLAIAPFIFLRYINRQYLPYGL